MDELTTTNRYTPAKIMKYLWVSCLVGIGSGLLGMMLVLLLHFIQHIAYGYSPSHIISAESFYKGVNAASSQRKLFCLFICGLIAGIGWYNLYHYGKPLVSINEALNTNKKMPVWSTINHALLQICTIALGSPLGREVAPRELGALFATWVAKKTYLNSEETKILIACGAGAGLAAVYNVPFGGALFTLEVLLASYQWSLLIPAFITAAIATLVSWSGLGMESIYHIPNLVLNPSIIIWAILTGPIFGMAGFWFIRIANQQRAQALRNYKMIGACLLNFLFIGLLALYFPILLGNGKSTVQIELTGLTSITLSSILLILHCFINWSSLRAGAQGGLLTPSLANGALLAAVLGGMWEYIWPSNSLASYIIIGATSFLATAQKMPLTAIILIFEFTHIHFDFLVPLMLSVSEALIVCSICNSLQIEVRSVTKKA